MRLLPSTDCGSWWSGAQPRPGGTAGCHVVVERPADASSQLGGVGEAFEVTGGGLVGDAADRVDGGGAIVEVLADAADVLVGVPERVLPPRVRRPVGPVA